MLSIWFAVVLSKDMIISSFTFLENLGVISSLILLFMFYFGFLSLTFNRVFRSGNLNNYAYILWLTFLISLILLYTYANSFSQYNLNLVFPVSAINYILIKLFWIPTIFFISLNFIFYGSKRLLSKSDESFSLPKWAYLVMLIIGLTSLFFLVIYIHSNLSSMIATSKIKDAANLICTELSKTNGLLELFHYKIYMILVINLLVLARIIGTEFFYVFNVTRSYLKLG